MANCHPISYLSSCSRFPPSSYVGTLVSSLRQATTLDIYFIADAASNKCSNELEPLYKDRSCRLLSPSITRSLFRGHQGKVQRSFLHSGHSLFSSDLYILSLTLIAMPKKSPDNKHQLLHTPRAPIRP